MFSQGSQNAEVITVEADRRKGSWTRLAIFSVIGSLALVIAALTSGITGGSVSAASGTEVPVSAIAQLTSIAQQQATINGDAVPTSAVVVEATHEAALSVATPGDSVAGDAASESVYLVVMQGSFVGYGFSTAPGAPVPTGSYLSIVVDANSFWVTDEGLSLSAPPVSPSSLGTTTTLAVGVPSGSASG